MGSTSSTSKPGQANAPKNGLPVSKSFFGVFSKQPTPSVPVGAERKNSNLQAQGAPSGASSVAPSVAPNTNQTKQTGTTTGGSRKKKMKRVKRNKTNKYKNYKK